MDQIEPYRQIVQLQSEIVKISRGNRELRARCEELERALTEGEPAAVRIEATNPKAMVMISPEGLRLRVRLWILRRVNTFRLFRWLRV
jgi:hypothetical protein